MDRIKLGRLKKDDFHDVVNLLNNVFTVQNGFQMDFESIFPRIFIPEDKTMGWHIGAKLDGKLVGIAASYPLTYRVGGTDLLISAGGNVAVDGNMRGMGIMNKILSKFDEEDRAAGFDISYLHGDRFRYRNFGYERCGVECYFNLTRQMIGKDAPKRQFKYLDLREAEESIIKKVFDFYNTQKSYLIREYDSFMPSLIAKKRLPLAVFSEENELIAYMVIGKEDSYISEIFVKNKALFADVIKGFMEKYSMPKLFIGLPIYDPLVKEAHKICDRYHIMQPGNFKIYNFKRVVESFMREKAEHEFLPDGKITINSEVFGAWSIKKEGNEISVREFTGSVQYDLPGYTVYPFLFGTFNPGANLKNNEDELLLKTWFPLPLYCPYLT